MKFRYEDLLSGDPIPVPGVGHIRSPHLYELKPTSGIGTTVYNLYLSILSWDKQEIIGFMKTLIGRPLRALEQNEILNAFDTMTIVESARWPLQEAMAFFMCEQLIWDEKQHAFIAKDKQTGAEVGRIGRENFEDVRDMMLQANYVNVGRNAKPTRHSSAASQALWEKAQRCLKEQAKRRPTDRRTELGNIISKLSCAGTGYNLLNIYELTIFQLYDQFFQYGYLRSVRIGERAYSNYGGKDFDIQGWLNPITNL